MIFNLFCDASIDIDKKIACGGCVITCQDSVGIIHDVGYRRIIQLDATNNSSEILAIFIGVMEALKLRKENPGAIFRLFSDSKISLYGLRDWIKHWVERIQPNGTLISSSGQPVMNQQKFIDIFNLIVENNLRIEFYHQRGHVMDGKMTMDKARAHFIRANKVAPESLGLDIRYLCRCNDMVDKSTREAVHAYVANGIILPNTELEGLSPFFYNIRASMLHQYIRCIDKTTVRSHHDFKGGYNQ